MTLVESTVALVVVKMVDQFCWSSDCCKVYDVIAEPPLSLGANQLMSIIEVELLMTNDLKFGAEGAVAEIVTETTLL